MKKFVNFIPHLTVYSMIFMALAVLSPHASAQDIDTNPEITARLVANPIPNAAQIDAALTITLSPDWHTYWRNAGDSGLPPRFDWTHSDNINDVELFWPAPTRKQEQIFYTFGYSDAVTFPLHVTREDPSKPATLDVTANIMICNEICIPDQIQASLVIPAEQAADKEATKEAQKIIADAKKTVPQDTHRHIKIDNIIVSNDALVVTITSKHGFEGMDIFPVIEDDHIALTLPPQFIFNENTPDENTPDQAMLKIAKNADINALNEALTGKKLSLTITHGDDVLEHIQKY